MTDLALKLGSRLRALEKGLGTVPFDSGNTRPLEIPKGPLTKTLVLRLSGTLVIGTANAAAVFSEAPLGLLKKIEIVADGNKTLVSATGRDLFRLAHVFQGKQGELSPPLSTVGTRAFAATIVLDLQALRMVRPQEAYFDTRLFTKTELLVTWGAATDIATAGGGGGTIAIGAGTVLDVQSIGTTEGDEDILFDRIHISKSIDVVATNPELALLIPQSGLLAGILLRTDRDAGGGAGPVPVDDLIVDVGILSDNTVSHRKSLVWATLQRRNVIEFQLDGGATAGAQIPGYAFVDLSEDGMMSSLLNTYGLQDPQLLFNVVRTSGTEKIVATFLFYQPRRAIGAA